MSADRSQTPEPQFDNGRYRLPRLWGSRGFWQINLRWAVAPVMFLGVLLGVLAGFEFPVLPVLLIAVVSPLYNLVFAWIYKHYRDRLDSDPALNRRISLLEAVVDYVAMFLLIHFTGGVSSPLVVFLLFHVIITAIQFSRGTAFQLSAVAAGGMWFLLVGEIMGWLPTHSLAFRGQSIDYLDPPILATIGLLVFTAMLFLSAGMVSRVMRSYRQGVDRLARASAQTAALNEQLNGLYTMVEVISAERHLGPILQTATSMMTRVMDVPAATIKLLSEDGLTLRYVASEGLPEDLVAQTVIDLDRSPMNRRVIQGEALVQAVVKDDNALQLGPILTELGIRSAAFAPLLVENRVIGSMGIYSHSPDRFDERDTDFLEQAARLVAITIEDARINEAVEALMAERTQFMLQVAHNLRAPLSAGLSMMELLQEGYMGELTEQQRDYLQRIEDRLTSLDQAIAELLTIARARDRSHEIPDVVVDLEGLAAYTERSFGDEATRKGIELGVTVEADLPKVDSGADLLEQVMANLVSNSIKYTPPGGRVQVGFTRKDSETVEIRVADTGIGIPAAEQEKLFQEFFRASNAKQHTTTGTGLGLALVKQSVERHRGQLSLTSTEGEGTEVTIHLPIHQPSSALS
ncbi:MAG: HAMP domain-containing sensor histidine kinase [Thermoanaerobaculia bacterium]